MPKHVYPGLALLKNDVTYQRLINPIRWIHLHEQHFTKDWREAFNLDAHRPAHLTRYGLLCRRLKLNLSDGL